MKLIKIFLHSPFKWTWILFGVAITISLFVSQGGVGAVVGLMVSLGLGWLVGFFITYPLITILQRQSIYRLPDIRRLGNQARIHCVPAFGRNVTSFETIKQNAEHLPKEYDKKYRIMAVIINYCFEDATLFDKETINFMLDNPVIYHSLNENLR